MHTSKRHEVVGTFNQNKLKNVPFHTLAIDLSREENIFSRIDEIHPDVVIHCAAMANLEECENNPSQAQYLNAEIPGKLANHCKKNDIKLVHISTDAVFDGKNGNYSEQDSPNPLSIYAKTKLEGEYLVKEANAHAIITRVNFYGWSISGKRSLGEFFYNNLKVQNPINGFIDVMFCPLYVSLLTDLLLDMVDRQLSGLYHVVSSNSMSKYDFGSEIANQFEFDSSVINPISVDKSELIAERSKNLTLSTEKLSRDLGKSLPTIKYGIQSFYKDFQNGFAKKIRTLSFDPN
jgi:dTDP-4-dehydrorhamnose reductase